MIASRAVWSLGNSLTLAQLELVEFPILGSTQHPIVMSFQSIVTPLVDPQPAEPRPLAAAFHHQALARQTAESMQEISSSEPIPEVDTGSGLELMARRSALVSRNGLHSRRIANSWACVTAEIRAKQARVDTGLASIGPRDGVWTRLATEPVRCV